MSTEMNSPKVLPSLPHELHEWIENRSSSSRIESLSSISGSYSQDGQRMHIYNDALIASYSTREEALEVGKEIARQSSKARLIAGLPFPCSFKEGEP